MGLVIKTDAKPVTVFANEKTTQSGNKYTTYAIGISSKDKDGNWVNGFIDCNFKKGVELANKTKINIANAFPTVREYNGKKYNGLFIMEFDVAEQGEVPQSGDGFMDVPMDMEELPFA